MQVKETKEKARQIFLEFLIQEEYNEGDYICHQNEEGVEQFIIENQVAEVVSNGKYF